MINKDGDEVPSRFKNSYDKIVKEKISFPSSNVYFKKGVNKFAEKLVQQNN